MDIIIDVLDWWQHLMDSATVIGITVGIVAAAIFGIGSVIDRIRS